MVKNVKDARIVITHGGPASFIMPLQIGKVPIVVPRQKEFDEHVNNHQVDFSKAVEDRMGIIITVTDINKLEEMITNYNNYIKKMNQGINSNNKKFNDSLEQMVEEMFEEKTHE